MDVPDGDTEEDLAVVAIFKALLHHGGLGRAALQESTKLGDAELPANFVTAFEKAHANAELEREVSNELDLSRSNSDKELASQRTRAQFLLQFSAAEIDRDGGTADMPDSPTKAVEASSWRPPEAVSGTREG